MVSIIKLGGGYYLCRKSRYSNKRSRIYWFPVRAKKAKGGCIILSKMVSVPDELVGKKIRLRVEVIEDG